MKDVLINAQKRQELTNYLLELPAKFANPILQFMSENEVQTTEEDPKPIGGGGGPIKPPKSE